MSFFQINNNCNGCLACVQNCPASALDYLDQGEKRQLFHSMTRCARCGQCWRICPQEAIEFQHLLESDWDEVASMDLVRCAVCGEPLYTMDFSDTLTGKLDHKVETLCPTHRQSLSMTAWRKLIPQKTDSEGKEP
jgi:ferredoxin